MFGRSPPPIPHTSPAPRVMPPAPSPSSMAPLPWPAPPQLSTSPIPPPPRPASSSTTPVSPQLPVSYYTVISPQARPAPPSPCSSATPPAPPPRPDPNTPQMEVQPRQNPPANVPKRRAGIACRRCRRLRTRCLQTSRGQPPCQACTAAGLDASECIFPTRGQPDEDRDYRHPRVRSEKASRRDPGKIRRDILEAPVRPAALAPKVFGKGGDQWDLLPSLPEIIDAVDNFVKHYFQLGFIPKALFRQRLETEHRKISPFFLLCILSISARLTPSLVARHGTAVRAAEVYMEHASSVAMMELYLGPNIERCQSFYLLAIAEQGSAMNPNSSINLAIAMRMATLLQLHREETYVLVNPTEDLIVSGESARRTFWMLHSQDNLHSGPRSPTLMDTADITALLPCDESDFANAREPKSRAALENTQPALANPALIADKGRSLFATLIQGHYQWGRISRRAINHDKSAAPWEPTSDYVKIQTRLREWEQDLPPDHRWSSVLLQGYKQEGIDLAYLGVTMVPRLCNIVIRKAYIHEMIKAHQNPKMALFWANMARELFQNVEALYEQIESQYTDRESDEGPGAQMAAFCVYTCGFLACYACKYPGLCPESALSRSGPLVVKRILNILDESKHIWPLANRWYDHLSKFFKSQNGTTAGVEGSMADSREPIPHVLQRSSLNPPPLLAIQPRVMHPPTDGDDGYQTPSDTILPPLKSFTEPAPRLPSLQSPPPAPAHPVAPPTVAAVVPSPPQPPPPRQQQVLSPIIIGQPSMPTVAMIPKRSPDGLGLLIEAFDNNHHNLLHQQQQNYHHHQQPQSMSLAGTPYDPTSISPHDYYAQASLAMNDGYEHELGYFISDGLVTSPVQNWVATGQMYR